MPLLQINSNLPQIEPSILNEIHLSGAEILADQIGKSIEYVMVIINTNSSLSFAQDSKTSAAYLEVKNVGELDPNKTQRMSKMLSELVSKKLGICPTRIYIEFQQSERHLWGWNGATFA